MARFRGSKSLRQSFFYNLKSKSKEFLHSRPSSESQQPPLPESKLELPLESSQPQDSSKIHISSPIQRYADSHHQLPVSWGWSPLYQDSPPPLPPLPTPPPQSQPQPKGILKKISFSNSREEPPQPEIRPKYSLSYDVTDTEIIRLGKLNEEKDDKLNEKDLEINKLESLYEASIHVWRELKKKLAEYEKGGIKLAEENKAVQEKQRLKSSNESYIQDISRLREELEEQENENKRYIQDIGRLKEGPEKGEEERMKLINAHDLVREKQKLKTKRLEKEIERLGKEKDVLEVLQVTWLVKCRGMEQQVLDVEAKQDRTRKVNVLLKENNTRLRGELKKSLENVEQLEWAARWAARIAKQAEWRSSSGRRVVMRKRERFSVPA